MYTVHSWCSHSFAGSNKEIDEKKKKQKPSICWKQRRMNIFEVSEMGSIQTSRVFIQVFNLFRVAIGSFNGFQSPSFLLWILRPIIFSIKFHWIIFYIQRPQILVDSISFERPKFRIDARVQLKLFFLSLHR